MHTWSRDGADESSKSKAALACFSSYFYNIIRRQPFTMSSNLVESDTRFREYFKKYRSAKTVNTIPYSSELPQKDSADTPLGNFNSKKVTVVGMGQVGLGCVAAIINQDICGTIAVSTVNENVMCVAGLW